MTGKQTMERFDDYVYEGETIVIEEGNYTFQVTIVEDCDTRPEDSDCYTEEDIQAWKDDKWSFCGVVISAQYNGVKITDCCSALWGIEVNFPDTDNSHLNEVVQGLLPEARENAREALEHVRQRLAA